MATGTANAQVKQRAHNQSPDPKEPLSGLVFKIVADTNWELYYFRIYSGTLKPNSKLLNPGKNAKELIGKIYHTKADPSDRVELSEAVAGDIVALLGL